MDIYTWTDQETGLEQTCTGPEARELRRLTEELTAQKALLEYELTAGTEEIRQLRVAGEAVQTGAIALERARIRRELLDAFVNVPGGGEDGEGVDLTWTDLGNLVGRICPE